MRAGQFSVTLSATISDTRSPAPIGLRDLWVIAARFGLATARPWRQSCLLSGQGSRGEASALTWERALVSSSGVSAERSPRHLVAVERQLASSPCSLYVPVCSAVESGLSNERLWLIRLSSRRKP